MDELNATDTFTPTAVPAPVPEKKARKRNENVVSVRMIPAEKIDAIILEEITKATSGKRFPAWLVVDTAASAEAFKRNLQSVIIGGDTFYTPLTK